MVHRYKELHLVQLRAYRECVRQKSFSAAARALGMSQPAVWQQVRALERDLGAVLLQRRGRDWEPSEDGRLLLELAASILGPVDALRETFDQRRRQLPRSLTVIGSPGVLTEELAQPVVAFCRQHPHVLLTLLGHAGLRTLDLLLAGEADLAVLPLASEVGAHKQLLTTEPLCERPWVLAMPARHPLAKQSRWTLPQLARCPLILPEQTSNWRRRVDDLFRSAGLLDEVQVVLEVGITLAARRFVSLGLGIALLPEPAGALTFPKVLTRPLGPLLPSEPIVLLWRRGSTPRPQARLFADFLKEKLAPRQ